MLSKIYKNWIVHNVVSHPIAGVLDALGFDRAADWVHNATVPDTHPQVSVVSVSTGDMTEKQREDFHAMLDLIRELYEESAEEQDFDALQDLAREAYSDSEEGDHHER